VPFEIAAPVSAAVLRSAAAMTFRSLRAVTGCSSSEEPGIGFLYYRNSRSKAAEGPKQPNRSLIILGIHLKKRAALVN